jgi:hypothetical protein
MSEHEFELYLRLLGKFLRLTPGQQADMADELRDHLEARLEELSRGGLSRDDAIRLALDEFGDAAHLADHFTQIVRLKRRKLIMRCTLGTVAASAVALFVATAFWPHDARVPVAGAPAVARAADPVLAADVKAADPVEAKGAVVAPFAESEQDRMLRDKLANTPHECQFQETPLGDVLTEFSLRLRIDVYAPKQQFESFLGKPITLQIQHAKVSARAALELVLTQAELGYVVRDGIVMICEPNALTELRIYDTGSLNLPATVDPDPYSIGGLGGFGGGAVGEKAADSKPQPIRGIDALADLVTRIISPDSWAMNGGSGADLQVFGDRMVVRAPPTTHREIESLLEQIGRKQIAAR